MSQSNDDTIVVFIAGYSSILQRYVPLTWCVPSTTSATRAAPPTATPP